VFVIVFILTIGYHSDM